MKSKPAQKNKPAKKKPAKKKLAWCVYVLECGNGDLYTGITGDLERRFKQHQSGNGGKFTRTFGVKQIVYWEKARGRSQALKRECEIKSWPRKKKLELTNAPRG
ncbi:MAG: GIY-YIG nuclease family protein [Candidatus Omnitrophica bacterium]|nr:GIY-YIG nuclease family protein [Candidatus Omnitrophota bacterium]